MTLGKIHNPWEWAQSLGTSTFRKIHNPWKGMNPWEDPQPLEMCATPSRKTLQDIGVGKKPSPL